MSLAISNGHLHLGNVRRVLYIRAGAVDGAATHVVRRDQLNHFRHWNHVLLGTRLFLSRLARSRPCRRPLAKFVTFFD